MTQYKYTDSYAPTDSSFISEVYYDENDWRLFIRMNSGSVYGYYQVPKSIYEGFKTANSPGGYYNAYIRYSDYIKTSGSIELVAAENLHDFEVTVQGSWTVTVKAGSVDEAKNKALADVPEKANATVKEVKVSFE